MIERLRWFYRAWRYRLKLETKEIHWLLNNLKASDVAVDVGAHKGAYTYWMRRRVGPGGRVFAFEPQANLALRLQQLTRSGRGSGVVVEPVGLSSQPATLDLRIPGQHASPGASFETTEDNARPGHTVSVEVTTLDRYFGDQPEFTVSLVKCDVEGHELEVFRGSEKLLKRDHPHLLFECESRHLGGRSPSQVFSFLETLGYRGFYFGQKDIREIESFDPKVHQAKSGAAGYVNNFLFMWDEGKGH